MKATNNVTLNIDTVESLTINQNGGTNTIEGLDETLQTNTGWRVHNRAPNLGHATEDAWLKLHLVGSSIQNISISSGRPYQTVQGAIGRAAIRKCFRDQVFEDPYVTEEYTDDHAEDQALKDCQAKVRNLEALIDVLKED